MNAVEIKEKILCEIQERIISEERYINYHNAIAKVLREKYDGKQLTKRIEGQVRAELGLTEDDPTRIIFVNDYLLKLEVWTRNYNDRLSFHLGHQQDRLCYNPARFEDIDGHHGEHARKRNEFREGILADGFDEVVEAVLKKQAAKQALEEANKALENLTSEFPESYFIKEL